MALNEDDANVNGSDAEKPWRRVIKYRKYILIYSVPILLLPLPIAVNSQAASCGYVLLIMALYWMTEALPIAVTSLLPLVLFPLLGIMKSKDVCMQYMQPTTVLLLGGVTVALAMENCNLHKRLALRVLRTVGTYPCWLLAGFMLPSWFLSQWISNTATAAMMVPVAVAVIDQSQLSISKERPPQEKENKTIDSHSGELSGVCIEADQKSESSNNTPLKESQDLTPEASYSSSTDQMEAAAQAQTRSEKRAAASDFTTALLLSVAYSCFIGGTASLTGTPSNLIMKGVADGIYASHGMESPISFTSWLGIGYPLSTLMIVLAWIWLQVVFLGRRNSVIGYFRHRKVNAERSRKIAAAIRKQYDDLGPIKLAEIETIVCFVMLLLIWFFRKPGFMDGWDTFFKKGYVSSAVPAVAFAILVFAIPSTRCCSKNQGGAAPAPLLTWDVVHRRMPWNVLLLMGGGLALAEGIMVSGLSRMIGDALGIFRSLPGSVMVLVISTIIAFITDVVSNPATATVLSPILGVMSERMGMNPLYLMFPGAFASSLAFCLPVASPPAAIVFSTGRFRIRDMVKTGVMLNALCAAAITLAAHTWGQALFKFHVIPWRNSTISVNNTLL